MSGLNHKDPAARDSFTLPISTLSGTRDSSGLSGGICIMDLGGQIVYQTPSFIRMTRGYTLPQGPEVHPFLDVLLEISSQVPYQDALHRRFLIFDPSGETHLVDSQFTFFTMAPNNESGMILVHLQDLTGLETLAQEILSVGRYQDVLGKTASMAVKGVSMQEIANYAALETARALDVEFCKILILGDSDHLLHLLSGVGWNPGLVGTYVQEGGDFSQAGYAIRELKPVIVRDLLSETRFSPSRLLSEHKVRSGVSVPMMFGEQVLGVMGAHTTSVREFSDREIEFLKTMANTIATIIERWRREETQLSLYNRLFAQVQDGVILTDKNRVILEWNPAMERMSGYSRKEAIGKTPQILSSGRQGDAFYREISSRISSGQPFVGRFINRRKDQSEFLVWETISPVMDPDQTIHYYIAILTDLSDREKLLEALRHTEQIKLVGQLAGGILHEIRNPLIGIGSLATHLGNLPDFPSAYRRQISLIADEARRIDELLASHLAQLRPRSFDFQPLNLEEILVDVGSLLEETFRKARVDFNVVQGVSLPKVIGARGPLQQVFINLLMNAVEAMGDDGGAIWVSFREEVIEKRRGCTVIVKNTGKGIPEQVLRRLNEPFFTHGKAKGVGLGLSICRDILDRHEGRLQIKSPGGEGVVVTVFIPIK